MPANKRNFNLASYKPKIQFNILHILPFLVYISNSMHIVYFVKNAYFFIFEKLFVIYFIFIFFKEQNIRIFADISKNKRWY